MKMIFIQDFLTYAEAHPIPEEVNTSYEKYLDEYERGLWDWHERPLAVSMWYALWLSAKQDGGPMYTDNVTAEAVA